MGGLIIPEPYARRLKEAFDEGKTIKGEDIIPKIRRAMGLTVEWIELADGGHILELANRRATYKLESSRWVVHYWVQLEGAWSRIAPSLACKTEAGARASGYSFVKYWKGEDED